MDILVAILVLCIGSVHAASSPFCMNQAIKPVVGHRRFLTTSASPKHLPFPLNPLASSQLPVNGKSIMQSVSNYISHPISNIQACAARVSTGPTDRVHDILYDMYVTLSTVGVQAEDIEKYRVAVVESGSLPLSYIDELVNSFSSVINAKHLEFLLTKWLGSDIYHQLSELMGDYSLSFTYAPAEISTELASNSISLSHVSAAEESIEPTFGGNNIHQSVLDGMYNVLKKECSAGPMQGGDIEELKLKFKNAFKKVSLTSSDFDELVNSFYAVIMHKRSPSSWLLKFMRTTRLVFFEFMNAKHMEILLTKRLGCNNYDKLIELLGDFSLSITYVPAEVSTQLASNSLSLSNVWAAEESIEPTGCYKSVKMIEEMYDALTREKVQFDYEKVRPSMSDLKEIVKSLSAVVNAEHMKHMELLLTKRLISEFSGKLNDRLSDIAYLIFEKAKAIELSTGIVPTVHGKFREINLRVLDAMYDVFKECSEGPCEAVDNEEVGFSVQGSDFETLKKKFKHAFESEDVSSSDFDEIVDLFYDVIMPKHSPSRWLLKFMLTTKLEKMFKNQEKYCLMNGCCLGSDKRVPKELFPRKPPSLNEARHALYEMMCSLNYMYKFQHCPPLYLNYGTSEAKLFMEDIVYMYYSSLKKANYVPGDISLDESTKSWLVDNVGTGWQDLLKETSDRYIGEHGLLK